VTRKRHPQNEGEAGKKSNSERHISFFPTVGVEASDIRAKRRIPRGFLKYGLCSCLKKLWRFAFKVF